MRGSEEVLVWSLIETACEFHSSITISPGCQEDVLATLALK
jgi:hypothetical protein